MDKSALIQELAADEAIRLFVYDDATGKPLKPGDTIKGHPTVGIGRALDVRGITHDEALALCQNDVDLAAQELSRALPVFNQLSEVRQRVIANMWFALGLPKLLLFKGLIAALEAADYDRAANEILSSVWAKQVGDRARRLAKRMATGV